MKIALGVGIFLTFLLVTGVFAEQSLLYVLPTPRNGAAPPPPNFPCQPVAFNAANPAASGYQVVFQDTFPNLSSIDVNNTQVPGFKWYVKPFFDSNNEPASTFTLNGSNGLTIKAVQNSGPGYAISTLLSGSSPTTWHGTVFSKGAYFEAVLALDGPTLANCFATNGLSTCGWPAFWTMAMEHDNTDRATEAQWPGQAAGYEHFQEDDFFEWDIPASTNNSGWGSGLWDWSAAPPITCSGYSVNGGAGAYCGLLNNGSPQQPNNVFLCGSAGCPSVTWNLTTFHTIGNLWVIGDSNNGFVGSRQVFFDGAASVPNNGGSSKTTWSTTTMPSPASLPNSPQVWSIHDAHHFPVILGSGLGVPAGTNQLNVKAIRVWQIPGCGVTTTQ